ncbi:MAG: ATP-binding protein [Lachnospiraceae bacterium]|nr:ATP-binding protein [Lachnospiraceae bacterium]
MAEGYHSLEEHMQEYVEVFLGLQQEQPSGFFEDRKVALEEKERETQVFLPAVCLRESYFLTQAEYWIMMFAFCCELEEGLCLDFRNKYREDRPCLQYILHLLSGVMPVGFSDVAGFCEKDGALRDIMAWDAAGDIGLMQLPLRLDPTVFSFLLTGKLPREDWHTFHGSEEGIWEERELFPLHEKERRRLRGYLQSEEPLRILLYGSMGSGSHTLIRRVCRETRAYVLFIRIRELFPEPALHWPHIRRTLRLFCVLLAPVAVAELSEGLSGSLGEEWEGIRSRLFGVLEDVPLCILAQTQEQAALVREYTDVQITLNDAMSQEEKRMALDAWLAQSDRRPWQEELLAHYRLNIGEWKKRQRKMNILAQAEARSPADPEIWREAMQERQEIWRFGRLIEDRYSPEEIVLPKDCQRQLETVARLARAWRGGRGLQLLFYGTSGTGKTMAASILAGQLGLPLLKVDLSQVFDKYIGETEKHLDEIFRAARRGHYLLFFDEADALFAKRTAVRDSHDRYANVSAAFLLQRMEEYEGILILATNLRDHFDDAFVRRIRFAVKFRDLDREGRERLWRKCLEDGLPAAPDVDIRALAGAAELSPARISSAAHVAKLLAACDGSGAVTGDHLREALTLEAGKDETTIGRF